MTEIDSRVSVVIPCHSMRRWGQLVAAVESVLAQSPRPAQVVVTVDHNAELFVRAKQELTGVTVVANELPCGASGNRNTGIGHTNTPFIVLLDDDAQARPGWLAGLLGPLAEADVMGTGGAIVPRWGRPRPSWFPDEFLWTVAATPVLPPAAVTVRNVWSASMALRREAFEAAGGFRVGFAPRGDGTGLEDTDLCLRMTRSIGGRWVHVPDAVVDHAVPAGRMTLRFLLVRCYREGRGKIEMARLLGGRRLLDLERRYLGRVVALAILRGLGRALRGRGLAHAARAGVLLLGMAAAVVGVLAALSSGVWRPRQPVADPVPIQHRPPMEHRPPIEHRPPVQHRPPVGVPE
jgi:GT2 family glycosyltransferase